MFDFMLSTTGSKSLMAITLESGNFTTGTRDFDFVIELPVSNFGSDSLKFNIIVNINILLYIIMK